MGTFAWTSGILTVPEEKKAELRERVYELFCRGGLCAFEEVALKGKKLYLMTPPEVKENGSFCAWHSYFEDDSWETAGFNATSSYVWSNKLGWKDFNTVVFAAYILEEQYSTTPFYANIDGRKRDFEIYGGWLNYLFDEKFSMQNRNYWDLYLAARQDQIENNRSDEKITCTQLSEHSVGMDVMSLLAMLCAENEEFIFEDKIKERDPQHEFSQNIYDLYHNLLAFQAASSSVNGADESVESGKESEMRQIDHLIAVMCGKADAAWRDSALRDLSDELASLMKKLIPQIVVRLIGHVYHKSFWDVWDRIGSAETICMPYIEEKPPVEPVTTQQFLTHETRYYLYFWREDNGISLDGLEGWFEELRARYDCLMSDDKFNAESQNGIQMLMSMIETLNKANEHYGCIFAFREMFDEFLEHCSERSYQVWWKIFCDLVEENWDEDSVNEAKIRQRKSYVQFDPKYLPDKEKPARAEIKGYLGLMANKELRKKVFLL